jgi:hypothetical protein
MGGLIFNIKNTTVKYVCNLVLRLSRFNLIKLVKCKVLAHNVTFSKLESTYRSKWSLHPLELQKIRVQILPVVFVLLCKLT